MVKDTVHGHLAPQLHSLMPKQQGFSYLPRVFVFEQHCTVDSNSQFTPWAAFLQYWCLATYSPFFLCAFDFFLLSLALCTFVYWVVDFLQFHKIFLHSQSIHQNASSPKLDDVCIFYEYSLFPCHRLLMKILYKIDSTQMLEGPRSKILLNLTENNW